MDWFGELFVSTSFLDPVSPEERLYYLLSASILLFFTMSACFACLTLFLRYRNNLKEKRWKEMQRRWDTDVLNALSGDMTLEALQKKIPPKQELNFIKYLTPYAWLLSGSDLVRLSELAEPFLPNVEKQLRKSNPEIRAWAVNALSLLGMPKYTPMVMQLLRDDSSVVAMSAANALLMQGKVEYIDAVLKYFHRFDHWNLVTLTSLIASIGPEAKPVLRRIFLDRDTPARTRVVAVQVLGKLNDYDIADQVALMLETETDQELIASCLRLLRGVGQTSHRGIVKKLCLSENPVIRVNAIKTLRNISIAEDIPLFRQGLADTSSWVALQSAWGLHDLGDDEFLSALVSKGHSRAVLAKQILAEGKR